MEMTSVLPIPFVDDNALVKLGSSKNCAEGTSKKTFENQKPIVEILLKSQMKELSEENQAKFVRLKEG